MFRLILTSIITLLHIYVFWRAGSVPVISRNVSIKALTGIGVVMWAFFVLGRVYGHDGTGPFARPLEIIGMNWMATLFLLFVCVLFIDIITCFGFLFSKAAPFLRGWAMAAALVLSLIAMVQGLRPPAIQNYEVSLENLTDEMDGKVIVAVSDMHLGSLIGKGWLEARVKQIQGLKPDMVFFLGDILEGHGEMDDGLLDVMKEIKAPLGLWAVTGNHEFHGGLDGNMKFMKDAGFKVLHDQWVEVKPGFIVAGIDDLTARRRAGLTGDTVTKTLRGRPEGATIFLSHTPWEVEKAAKQGVGLMLSGHTHGGQIWPFGYLVRLTYPLMGGQYEIDGMNVIVCRGTGTWGPRMRLWRRGEIVSITIVKDSKSFTTKLTKNTKKEKG